jgi:hypothetical protein
MDNNERTSMVVFAGGFGERTCKSLDRLDSSGNLWGKSGVNLNGELGNFFKTHKG